MVLRSGQETEGETEREREKEREKSHLLQEFSQRAGDDVPCPVLTAEVRVAEVKGEGSRH